MPSQHTLPRCDLQRVHLYISVHTIVVQLTYIFHSHRERTARNPPPFSIISQHRSIGTYINYIYNSDMSPAPPVEKQCTVVEFFPRNISTHGIYTWSCFGSWTNLLCWNVCLSARIQIPNLLRSNKRPLECLYINLYCTQAHRLFCQSFYRPLYT